MCGTHCLSFWLIADTLRSSTLLACPALLLLSPLLLTQLLVGHMRHVAKAAVHPLPTALLLEAIESARNASADIMQLAANRPLSSMALNCRVLDFCCILRTIHTAGLGAGAAQHLATCRFPRIVVLRSDGRWRGALMFRRCG